MRNYEDIMKRMDEMQGGSISTQEGLSQRPEDMRMESTSTPIQSSGQKVTPSSGSGAAKTAGQGMMMTGNPYLMAGGLGLQVLGQAKERELVRESQNINNEIARRDKVMQMMGQLGSGFGRLG